MTSVTIFGKGAMGTAIADVLTAGGATVDHIQSSDPPGPVNGDIVVLAVPHPALKDILEEYADKLAGKIVVDVTNPVDFETFDSLVVPAHSSMAAVLADELPSSRVLKARTRPSFSSPATMPTRRRPSFRPFGPAVWTSSTPAH
jgi:8-hydroxy-5-deazaflavin:NADPH oxidoreductase